MKERMLQRLSELGLDSLLEALFEPGSPLALLGAQALYVAQPVLGAFAEEVSIMALAHELEGWTGGDESKE